jgi:hypothetical protein
LSAPTPAFGVNNVERASFIQRAETDLVLALALIHHLCIGHNIPFNSVAQLFRSFGRYLIVEFVPKTDEKVQLMLSNKKDIYDEYTYANFIASFEQEYKVMEIFEVDPVSKRTLFLMEAIQKS